MVEDFETTKWTVKNEYKKCPHCGRKAKEESIRCRYCWNPIEEISPVKEENVRYKKYGFG